MRLHHLYLSVFLYAYLGSAVSISTSGNLASPHHTWPIPSNAKANCISAEQWPDWSGEISYQNCWRALTVLRSKVPSDHPYIFWSGKLSDHPPPSVPWPWRLPNHADAGEFACSGRTPAVLRDY